MKKIITVLVLCLASYGLQAQDLIYTKREGVLKAKVIEITHALIRFKKAENIDGPNYTIANRYVDSIRYENGSKELFSFRGKRLPEKYIKELEQFNALPNNLVSTGFELSAHTIPFISPSDRQDQTPFAAWYVAYERLIVQQRIGISMSPFAASNRRYYGASAAIQFYPKNKGRMRLGLGPVFNYSVQNRQFRYFQPVEYGGNRMRMETKTHVTSLAVNLSILGNLNRRIFIDSDLFLGAKLKEKPFKHHLPDQWQTSLSSHPGPMMGFRLGVGYRF
ncbi:hypothetical protein U0035_08615 [Niabella yanshanensis]|uniref:DUF3575 domain-containing protein n=1 Tax=Niabella yanshanensis TaxID=577386 RepID=A0ABZ0WA77_9BACT|nr:hypothetical protein [Niabella yanshanensis]WQD40205.1 hypothetical protein U0035_08615 [Niabella yanshanensis]